jgi:hypothetical protein
MFADEFLPTYDVSDAVGVVVSTDAAMTWDALMDVDLIEVGRSKPLVGLLGGIRMAPELVSGLLHGRRPNALPERMRLRDTTALPADRGGWILLGERPGEAIALGLVGKFWRPVIAFADGGTASDCRSRRSTCCARGSAIRREMITDVVPLDTRAAAAQRSGCATARGDPGGLRGRPVNLPR